MIFTVILMFSVVMGLADLMILFSGVMELRWGGVVFGTVGLLICWGYGDVAWHGVCVMRRIRKRSEKRRGRRALPR